jgi:hypothetical protein
MKPALLLCSLTLFAGTILHSQTGKYFIAVGEKCKTAKVFIDGRILDYCGNDITVSWTGGCSETFADGSGKLTVISKVPNRVFTLEYEGVLKKGKKQGNGTLQFFQSYPAFNPAYSYRGSFKNDEFDGYGEFSSHVAYPPAQGDIENGTDISVTYRLDKAAWRTDLFFYEYKGYFANGKIADSEKGSGKTKRLKWLADEVEYTGSVKNGRPNGPGKAVEATIVSLPNAQSYLSVSGNFANGMVNGYGKETGRYFEYEGEFVNSTRQGKGKMTIYGFNSWFDAQKDKTLKEGRYISYILDGNFTNGYADGFFTIYYQNSAAYKYTGPIKNGALEGTGEIEYLDGSKLRGSFRNGQMEGDGAVIFANGAKFTGIYANGKPVKGTYYFGDGSKYEGEMAVREEKDKITGKPTNTYVRQGSGVMTDKDGRRYNVSCNNGDCTETN